MIQPSSTSPSPSSSNTASPVNRWALDLAVAAGLVTLLDVAIGGALQFGLFLLGLIFNAVLVRRRLPRAAQILRLLYYLATLPLFLLLSGKTRLSEEWMPVRVITYALLGGLYLLPLIPRPSLRDLRRITVVLAGSFFFSAIYFSTPVFLGALIVAAFALFVAFHSAGDPGRPGEKTPLLVQAASGHLLLTLLAGSLVFFAFPRDWFRTSWGANPMGKGLISGAQPRSQDMFEVGASSRRDVLQFANLIDWSRSGSEVLRLRMTLNKTGEPFYASNSMYLRASLFESYEEGNWRSRQPSATYRDQDDGVVDGWTWVQPGGGRLGGKQIRQSIRMNALDDFCFCLPDPLAINQPMIKYETRGILIFPNKPLLSVDYEVISELPTEHNDPRLMDPSRRRIPLQMSRYLGIPHFLQPLLSRVASRWDKKANRGVLAEQIRQFLQNQFTYGPVGFVTDENMDPMQIFLTKSRQGYCTHFASAMALLARSVGMPARVATGFHFAGPPEPDGSYVIRELNAHAWTEIFFPDQGWVIFDATPPSQRPILQRGPDQVRWWSFLSRLAGLTDQLAEYDSTDQKTFLLRLVSLFAWLFSEVLGVVMAPLFWIGLAVAGLLAWAILKKLPPHQRRRLQRRFSRRKLSLASSVPFYSDLLWILDRHGHSKLPSLTPQEFAETVTRQFPSPEVMELTRLFYRVKFGGTDLRGEEHSEVRRQLDQVERDLAKGNHRASPASPIETESWSQNHRSW